MAASITRLTRLKARLESVTWDFATERRAEIDAHWASLIAQRPAKFKGLFNGTVLMQHRWSLQDGVYETAYTPVDYASFIAWIQLGQPGAPRRNGFAMGALESTDGAFVLGVMAAHTVNAGKIYFPGGTPDLHDVTPDGRVDLSGSLTRELFEETGLRPDEVTIREEWVMVTESYRAAFLKPALLAYDAETAQQIMLGRLASDTDEELADIVIVRQPTDINDAKTPEFAAAYMRWAFANR